MRKKLLVMALAFCLTLGIIPVGINGTYDTSVTVKAAEKPTYLTIKENCVNFRKSPGGTILRQLHKGYQVILLSTTNIPYANGHYWYNVSYNGLEGYVARDYVY